MNNYQKAKARARQQAIDWQLQANENEMYWSELASAQSNFRELARRYGLTK